MVRKYSMKSDAANKVSKNFRAWVTREQMAVFMQRLAKRL